MKQIKHMRRVLVGWVAIGTLVLVSGPAQAGSAKGPYYATPSWDQTLPCPTHASCPRFTVLTNFNSDAVLDRETGLVWEQTPDTNGQTWFEAQTNCNQRPVGNRRGWRLPTVQELASLVDPNQSNPALPPGHPFSNVQSNVYWSATT